MYLLHNKKMQCNASMSVAPTQGDLGKDCTYVGGVDVTLNNVENRDVACGLARYGGNHPVFRLK
jgi:hypothetical protein